MTNKIPTVHDNYTINVLVLLCSAVAFETEECEALKHTNTSTVQNSTGVYSILLHTQNMLTHENGVSSHKVYVRSNINLHHYRH